MFLKFFNRPVFVGKDQFGNRYYKQRRKHLETMGSMRKERRFVKYRGKIAEPSFVPPLWHGWLHHRRKEAPTAADFERIQRELPWVKAHLPNLTGTPYAYYPEGSSRYEGGRALSSSDYEAWNPSSLAQAHEEPTLK